MFYFTYLRLLLSIPFFLLTISFGECYSAGMKNPPGNPVEVQVGVFVTDIVGLSELNENLQINMILRSDWVDDSLSFDSKVDGVAYKLYQGVSQIEGAFPGWSPQLYIVNEVGMPQIQAAQIKVYPDGFVVMNEARTVLIETPMSLQKFPFDKQNPLINLVNFGDSTDNVVLKVDVESKDYIKTYIANNPNVNIAEWNLMNYSLSSDDIVEYFYGMPEKVSRIQLSLSLERKYGGVVWKTLLPLVFLVLAMGAVFWLNQESLSDRLNISFIGVLSIVAYQFSVGSNLPNIDYLTFADIFLLVSFVILFITIIESIFVYTLFKRGYGEVALQVDIFFRWFFPICYAFCVFLLYILYV